MSFSGNELREQFLDFFAERTGFKHRVVSSAPLIPPDDPTLMFTSAGMVQFKSLYSGLIDPLPYSRAASCQLCLRAGGKGSDLENVGKTLRHHTLFEMLGNFSFGDYFKAETIRWGWEFTTQVLGLPKERLFPTIFEEDDEAEALWGSETDAVLKPVRLGAKENFWGPAGETGACGPCSEICFFMGSEEELAEIHKGLKENPDEAMKTLAHRIEEEGDLFLEIWNMVFPQFDQQRDGSRLPLKNRGIDTGAGLERMTTARLWLDGKASTPYETDLLSPIVQAAADAIGVKYVKILDDPKNEHESARLGINAIADHTRALAFCLAEGITPGNVGRGYVIRRIQRRALRFASLLGNDNPFMASLVDPVIDAMGGAYPHLKDKSDFIRKSLRMEEDSFLKTRNRGMRLLDDLIDSAKKKESSIIPGDEAFKLWDTYGFPIDMTREIVQDAALKVDDAGFEKALNEQKERSRRNWAESDFSAEASVLEDLGKQLGETKFLGYKQTESEGCKVLAILVDGQKVDNISAGDKGTVVLNQTPFYAESGGQIGDTGELYLNGDNVFDVADTQKTAETMFVHRGTAIGPFKIGDELIAKADGTRRLAIQRNHTSTHLLQSALKKHVGSHCSQAGSFVGPEGLRFDFSHSESVTPEQLRRIQEDVNAMIIADYPVTTEVMELEEAKKKGAIAPFGEKYGARVRVVEMGRDDNRVSLEFCGGIHLDRTGQASRFRILSEGSIASGVRRIEAVTGARAVEQELIDQYEILQPIQTSLATKGAGVVSRIEQLSQRVKQLEKELAQEKTKAATANLDQYINDAKKIAGCSVASVVVEGLGGNELRTMATSLQQKLGASGVAIVGSKLDDKIQLVVACGEDARKTLAAGKVVNAIAGKLGGKGGGKPELAQAGAKSNEPLEPLFATLPELLNDLNS